MRDCPSMGSIISGCSLGQRVSDIVNAYSFFPVNIKEGAQEIAMSLDDRFVNYSPSTTALACLNLSCQENDFAFRSCLDDVVQVYNGNEFHHLNPIKGSRGGLNSFVYRILQIAKEIKKETDD